VNKIIGSFVILCFILSTSAFAQVSKNEILLIMNAIFTIGAKEMTISRETYDHIKIAITGEVHFFPAYNLINMLPLHV